MPILFAYPGNEALASNIAQLGQLTIRRFPDGESYLRLESDVSGQDVAIVCSLNDPDQKATAIMFFSQLAREMGAIKVGLIAPYLGYMRQDKRFHDGEAITSNMFAKFISEHFDWLITIDPHLHRHKSLDEIYSIPAQALHATELIVRWIKGNVKNPVLIGPDEESIGLISLVAKEVDAPFVVMKKVRHGDRDIEINFQDLNSYKNHTPVLIDDVISTGQTLIDVTRRLVECGMKDPICIAVHGIFAGQAYAMLQAAGAKQVITTNTIPNPSNQLDVSGIIAVALNKLT